MKVYSVDFVAKMKKVIPILDKMRHHIKPLNRRQQLFFDHYIRYNDGAAAVEKAGYNCKDKALMAGRLLQHPSIMHALEERRGKLEKEADLTYIERKRFYASIAMDELHDVKDRMKAMELLGRMHGDFVTNNNHNIRADVRATTVSETRDGLREAMENPELLPGIIEIADKIAKTKVNDSGGDDLD
jgi:phage terminase small subunit